MSTITYTYGDTLVAFWRHFLIDTSYSKTFHYDHSGRLTICSEKLFAQLLRRKYFKMYIADERFEKNIDKYSEGTAAFASETMAAKHGAL